MPERTHDLPPAWWAYNFEELDTEIARLALLCGIELLRPGVIMRVLQRDATVCGTDNPAAFAKLHNLLKLHGAVREKSVDVLGQSQTAMIEAYVVDRLKKRFGDRFGS
ncbi:MAG: hypothetical protein BroJett031_19090 [Betaproteobacteria bacterium]|nr:MAG: hypothetical protein BroJett031_19090 [Betaproteobacteria bacterium]